MPAHELDYVTKAEAGGGVLAGTEGRSGPDLKTGDTLEILGKETGVAGDNEVVTDAEMKRGWLSLKKFPDPALKPDLKFPEGEDLGGVDLEDGRLAGALELGGGQFELCGGQRTSL